MSHYQVAVFANHPSEFEELLAPYNEADETYFEEVPARHPSDYLKERYDDLVKRDLLKDESFEEWLDDLGYVIKNGMVCVYKNPNGKWDWYTLNGGAWMFDLKDGEEYDDTGYARKNQYNYINTDTSAKECDIHWLNMLETASTSKNRDNVTSADRFLSQYPQQEDYTKSVMNIHPYAYITPDGVWHAPGTVGWFGMSDDTPDTYRKYLDEWIEYVNSVDNPYVTFVDCHI